MMNSINITKKIYPVCLGIIACDGIGFDMNMPDKNVGKSHVGMTNVKERLRQMCNATMTVESSAGHGCRTEVFIPSTDM